MSYLLCFGLGYSAQVLADRLERRGFRVVGTTRSQKNAQKSQAATLIPFDRSHPLDLSLFTGVSHVLVSIPPDADGDTVLDLHETDLINAAPIWIGYLSTTGVYGDTGGIWVDESRSIRPSIRRSIVRASVERAWLALWKQHSIPVHLFRLSGIYGRGRSAVDVLRQGHGHRVIKPNHVSSRIHVKDLATVLEASMSQPNPGSIYNVCDDEPAPPQDVMTYAAALLGWEPPVAISWEQAQHVLSPMALTFYVETRRVRNDKIKRELGVTLRYPTYREGLLECL